MELAGHQCIGFCEVDKYAVMSYVSMHLLTDEQREKLSLLPTKERQKEILKGEYRNGEWFSDDIRRVYAGDIPKADCWCFGFPCQDISVAGKQVGFYGNRSSLFFRVMYLLGQIREEDRPSYLFIENVKNLLSVNGGWDFARLLSEMDRGGYDAEWQIINSAYYVPQNRERCFIVGHLRGRGTAEVFPIEGTNRADCVRIDIPGHRANYRRNLQVFSIDGISEALDTSQGGGRQRHIAIDIVGTIDPKRHSQMDVMGGDGLSATLDTMHEPKKVAIPVLTPDRATKRQNGRRFKEDGDPSFTLTAQDRHGVAVGIIIDDQGRSNKACEIKGICPTLKSETHGNVPKVVKAICANETVEHPPIYVRLSESVTVYAIWYPKKEHYIAIRKLTPRECFRLQGWTDDYFEKAQFVNSDSQLYKQAGNGVTVPVIEAMAKEMMICFGQKGEK